MVFKFEEWITDAELNSYKLVGIDNDCGHLKHLPMFYAGCVYGSDLENPLRLEVLESGVGTYLAEFHSDPVPWEDFTDDYVKYFPIAKCPICGENLEVQIVKTIDKTDRIKELEEKREEVRTIMEKTDSIRDMKKLKAEMREINNEIDDIYRDTSYGEE